VLGSRERAGTGRPVCAGFESESWDGRSGQRRRSGGGLWESWESIWAPIGGPVSWNGRSILGSRVRAGTAGLGNLGDPVPVCERSKGRRISSQNRGEGVGVGKAVILVGKKMGGKWFLFSTTSDFGFKFCDFGFNFFLIK
jgi:hypothetical protein